MRAFLIDVPDLPVPRNRHLIFTIPRGKRTAVVVAQHTENTNGRSVVNGLTDILTHAFKTVPALNELDHRNLDFYTTFRLNARMGRGGSSRLLSRVEFKKGGRFWIGGMTTEKEWRFEGPDWHGPDQDGGELLALFDRAAWEAGYVPQVYDRQKGWSIPNTFVEGDEEDDL